MATTTDPFCGLTKNMIVHHRKQRVYGLTHGQPRLVAVGRVIATSHTINEGTPYVTVFWYGPEGGIETYHPEDIVSANAPLEA